MLHWMKGDIKMPDTLQHVLSLLEHCPDTNAQVAYKELADAVKGGTVIELPCKVGKRIYMIDGHSCSQCWKIHYHVVPVNVFGFTIEGTQILIRLIGVNKVFTLSDFGKTVFLTELAARKALEAQNGNS